MLSHWSPMPRRYWPNLSKRRRSAAVNFTGASRYFEPTPGGGRRPCLQVRLDLQRALVGRQQGEIDGQIVDAWVTD